MLFQEDLSTIPDVILDLPSNNYKIHDEELQDIHFFKFINNTYGISTSKLFKGITEFGQKIISTKSSLKFLIRCRELDIFPKALDKFEINLNHINLHSKTGKKTYSKDIHDFKVKTLNNLIEDSCIHIYFLHKKVQHNLELLENLVSVEFLNRFLMSQDFYNYKQLLKFNRIHID